MVFIWGTRGEVDPLGYVIDTCPACGRSTPFIVYQSRRRFTVYFVPTFAYGGKLAVECCCCRAAFEVPPEKQPAVLRSVMSQEELSRRMAEHREEAQHEPLRPQPAEVTGALLVLGLDSRASWEQAKRRYKEEATAWHPDRFEPGSKMFDRAQEKLKALNEARAVLEAYFAQRPRPRAAGHAADQASRPDAERSWQEELEQCFREFTAARRQREAEETQQREREWQEAEEHRREAEDRRRRAETERAERQRQEEEQRRREQQEREEREQAEKERLEREKRQQEELARQNAEQRQEAGKGLTIEESAQANRTCPVADRYVTDQYVARALLIMVVLSLLIVPLYFLLFGALPSLLALLPGAGPDRTSGAHRRNAETHRLAIAPALKELQNGQHKQPDELKRLLGMVDALESADQKELAELAEASAELEPKVQELLDGLWRDKAFERSQFRPSEFIIEEDVSRYWREEMADPDSPYRKRAEQLLADRHEVKLAADLRRQTEEVRERLADYKRLRTLAERQLGYVLPAQDKEGKRSGREQAGSEDHRMVPPQNAVTSGSFSIWPVPIMGKVGGAPILGEPGAFPNRYQDYLVAIQVKLPPDQKVYRLSDLSGIVIGTDGWRQRIPAYAYVRGLHNGFQPTRGNDELGVEGGIVQLFIWIPGANAYVRDTVNIKSSILKEEKVLELTFQPPKGQSSSDSLEGAEQRPALAPNEVSQIPTDQTSTVASDPSSIDPYLQRVRQERDAAAAQVQYWEHQLELWNAKREKDHAELVELINGRKGEAIKRKLRGSPDTIHLGAHPTDEQLEGFWTEQIDKPDSTCGKLARQLKHGFYSDYYREEERKHRAIDQNLTVARGEMMLIERQLKSAAPEPDE